MARWCRTASASSTKAFLNDFVPRIEEIAQESASTEATLFAKHYSEDEKTRMRLELELGREVECWEGIRTKIDELIARRKALVEGQIVRRQAERSE